MDLETLIKDTFAAHEHVAPDADEVLAATRGRIHRERTVLTRPLAVAAGVVLLALAAVTVVTLNRPDQRTPATGQTTGTGQTDHTAQAIEDVVMPFSLGWLPPGSVDYVARRINAGTTDNPNESVYGGEYLLDVKTGGQVLLVDVVETSTTAVGEATFKSGPGQDVTIGGRTGVESSHSGGPAGYELYLTRPGGGAVYVNVAPEPGSTASAQQLTSTGRRIAGNLHFPGNSRITPAFGLRDLPDGLRRCTFGISKGDPGAAHPGTSYTLGTCTTTPSIEVATDAPAQVRGTPGETVQGHATRYFEERGLRELWILDAVHGAPIVVRGGVARADLYAVANHVVLPR